MTICWFGNDNLFQPKIFYIHFQVFLSNLDSTQIIYEDNDSLQTLWPIWRYPSPEKLKIYLLPPHLAQAEGLKEGSFFLFLIRWPKKTAIKIRSVFNMDKLKRGLGINWYEYKVKKIWKNRFVILLKIDAEFTWALFLQFKMSMWWVWNSSSKIYYSEDKQRMLSQ